MAGVACINGIHVVYGEANAIIALLRKFRRNITHLPALDEHDPLLRNFADLCDVLNTVGDISDINFSTFLNPFLEVVKSDATDGPATARALSAIEKFINYGLLTSNSLRITNAVQSIAESVTKTKFIGAFDNEIDECVLFQILQTIKSLILSSSGRHLSNETICELLQCCFRMGLEPSLPILIRQVAECALADMTRSLHISLGAYEQDIRPCLKELLRFLIALTNPLDRTNTPQMILMGLNLLIIVFEVGVNYIRTYEPLLSVIRDELCKTLLSLLSTNKLTVFSATNRVCFLLFDSVRIHLKFQLESYFLKLSLIISAERRQKPESAKTAANGYAIKEIALESLVQMWRIPGLVSELYLNYDCGLYSNNLFEDLARLLLQNAFPLGGRLLSTHILSLDALLTVVNTIERNCQTSPQPMIENYHTIVGKKASTNVEKRPHEMIIQIEPDEPFQSSSQIQHSTTLPTIAEIIEIKRRKQIMAEGTELFNKTPSKGIEFLCEKGFLIQPLEPTDVSLWLRHNPNLDKKMIADYICSRKNTEIMRSFVNSFEFEGLRIDQALRLFLEAFRLPGEAPVISKIMQYFSEHWFTVNSHPFEHNDSAYTLSYAVIMLNTDQHNPQVRRQQPPMTFECFKRNVAGTNNGKDFDPAMLEQIYTAIKNEEIVMPAEQTGLVKENYLWKTLLRRGETSEGVFMHTPIGWNDRDLFSLVWGACIASISYVMDKCEDEAILTKVLNGYRRCATIAGHYGMTNVFDNLIIHLCKFSTLVSGIAFRDESSNMKSELEYEDEADSHNNDKGSAISKSFQYNQSPEAIAIAFSENHKARVAVKTMFDLVHSYGDNLREGWKNILDCLIYLLWSNLLPPELTNVEDFVDPSGCVSIKRPSKRKPTQNKNEGGLLSWLGFSSSVGSESFNIVSDPNKSPSEKELAAIKAISECHPEQLIRNSRYLTSSVLNELINCIIQISMLIYSVHLKKYNQIKSLPLNSHESDEEHEHHHHPHTHQVVKPKRVISHRLRSKDHDALLFLTEFLVSIVLENKDRLRHIWPATKQHLKWLMTQFNAQENPIIVERAITALIRITNRNLFRLMNPTEGGSMMEDNTGLADDVLQSLFWILKLRPPSLFLFSRQISYGLHSLLRSNAANIHIHQHWIMFFKLLEAVGAASYPDDIVGYIEAPTLISSEEEQHKHEEHRLSIQSDPEEVTKTKTDPAVDRGYCSDEQHLNPEYSPPPRRYIQRLKNQQSNSSTEDHKSRSADEWIHVDLIHSVANKVLEQEKGVKNEQVSASLCHNGVQSNKQPNNSQARVFERGTIILAQSLSRHDSHAFLKVCDVLTFLSRDAAHITPLNFESFVHCLRVMIEASLNGQNAMPPGTELPTLPSAPKLPNTLKQANAVKRDSQQQHHLNLLTPSSSDSLNESEVASITEGEQMANCYAEASLQLLGICNTLHMKSAAIFRQWEVVSQEKGSDSSIKYNASWLWYNCWRPLLQAMARMSCDCRRRMRAYALESLAVSMRLPELSDLESENWEDCFAEVLFPLLVKLLEDISPMDPIGVEETRIRAIQLTSKILLGNLSAIGRLQSFPFLIQRMFMLMNKFKTVGSGDLLSEVIEESLKNIVLVCENFGMLENFKRVDGNTTMDSASLEINERLRALVKLEGAGNLQQGAMAVA